MVVRGRIATDGVLVERAADDRDVQRRVGFASDRNHVVFARPVELGVHVDDQQAEVVRLARGRDTEEPGV